MHNLRTVIWFETVRTLKKKSFWLSVLAFPALIGVVLGVVYFSTKAADQATQDQANQKFSLAIMDNSGLVDPIIIQALKATVVTDQQTGRQLVVDGKKEAFFYYPADVSTQPVLVVAKDVGIAKNDKYSAVALQLLKTSQAGKISAQQQAVAQGSVTVNVVTYADGQVVPGLERIIIPGGILLLFYITFVLMAGRMLASTTEEKENRVIEMLLSNVQSRTLVTGKIVSMLMIGLVQVAAIALPVAMIVWLARNYVQIPHIDLAKIVFDPPTVLIAVLVFIFAYLLFTGILVAIGSAVPTAKEANSFMGVAMFSLFIPLYALQAIIVDADQPLVKFFTYFPLTSPITLLLRNAAGNLTWHEAVISITILAVCAVVALWVAARTFGYGTLEYSRKLSWREIVGRR